MAEGHTQYHTEYPDHFTSCVFIQSNLEKLEYVVLQRSVTGYTHAISDLYLIYAPSRNSKLQMNAEV